MKKKVREIFRNEVFKRDDYKCKTCGVTDDNLDAHHITNRDVMPYGGYVIENGISLCSTCHILAEEHYKTGTGDFHFSPENLYKLIQSSREVAIKVSTKNASVV